MLKSTVKPTKPQELTLLTVLWRNVMQTAIFTMGMVALTYSKHWVLFIMEGVTISCKAAF